MTESPPSGHAELRLFGLRGAAQAERNDSESILATTDTLLREMIRRNALQSELMVSCILTATADLDAEFPAVAARRLGLSAVPLLCTRQIDVPGAMPRVIRVLLHYYARWGHLPAHTYLGAAQALRVDLSSAQ